MHNRNRDNRKNFKHNNNKRTFYSVQCRLERGKSYIVSWIPEKFAIKGKVLKLKNDFDKWEDGWCVMECGTKMPSDMVTDFAEGYNKFKRVTDI